MKKFLKYLAIAFLLMIPGLVMGQISGGNFPIGRATTNRSTTIASGGTFQTVLASTISRFSLTIENNNSLSSTEYCYIFIGSGSASTATSIVLGPGGSYQRYWPFIPSDTIQATCTNTSDTLYIDTQ